MRRPRSFPCRTCCGRSAATAPTRRAATSRRRASRTAANNPSGEHCVAILDRLAGLETEYAIRFHPDGGDRAAPSHFELYNKLIDELRRDLPAVRASHAKLGYFFATGGSVWYEKPAYRPFALVEGATPECRGPRNVLTWQRAQDALLAEAARATNAAGEFTLCKSDADAWGRVYSGQENYEATLATGGRWWLWRVGCFMLIPLVALGWIAALHAAMLVVVYYVVAVPLWLAAWAVSRTIGAIGHARRAPTLKAFMIGDARGLVSDQYNVALPPIL